MHMGKGGVHNLKLHVVCLTCARFFGVGGCGVVFFGGGCLGFF